VTPTDLELEPELDSKEELVWRTVGVFDWNTEPVFELELHTELEKELLKDGVCVGNDVTDAMNELLINADSDLYADDDALPSADVVIDPLYDLVGFDLEEE
jgi:hypothetical protein